MKSRKLHSNIAKLLRRWNILLDPILGEGDLSMFESMLHEVAHAQLLNITPFDRNSVAAISSALEVETNNHAIRHEEQAWAIEWLLWDTFKLRPPFECRPRRDSSFPPATPYPLDGSQRRSGDPSPLQARSHTAMILKAAL